MSENFKRVATMNTAFGNPQGNPANIDWFRVRNQCQNILHEYVEMQKALGAAPAALANLLEVNNQIVYDSVPDLDQVRDSLCDIHVFSYGAHHLMGIDADADMASVIEGVMTRFIKDETDKQATIAKHAAKGVVNVYFEGDFPNMVMKSSVDQPDAPAGKFLKSASFREPVFYGPLEA